MSSPSTGRPTSRLRFLSGYAERRPLPTASSLAWHTAAALLAERALRAVNRVNRTALAHLAEPGGRRRRDAGRRGAPMSRPRLLFYCQHSLGPGPPRPVARDRPRPRRHLRRDAAQRRTAAGGHGAARRACGSSTSRRWATTRTTSWSASTRDWTVADACRERRRTDPRRAGAGVAAGRCSSSSTRSAARSSSSSCCRCSRPRGAPAPDRPLVLCSLRRHPGPRAPRPGRARRAGRRPRQRLLRRGARALRPGVRPAGGDVHPEHAAAGAGPLHRASSRRRRSRRCPTSSGCRRLLVSAGGGMVGEPLFREAVRLHTRLAERTGLGTTVVAGPFLPEPGLAVAPARGRPLAAPARRTPRRRPLPRDEPLRSVAAARPATTRRWTSCAPGRRRSSSPTAPGREDEQADRARRLEDLGRAARRCRPTSWGPTASSTSWSPSPAPGPAPSTST